MNLPPDLAASINALRYTDHRLPEIKPTDDELEVADVLEEIAQLHRPTRDHPDDPTLDRILRTYGACLGCGEIWPCTAWVYAEQSAVEWVGRASNRYLP